MAVSGGVSAAVDEGKVIGPAPPPLTSGSWRVVLTLLGRMLVGRKILKTVPWR